ncbi:MAG: Flagellar assembly factor FliW [Clostridia bacterium]|jgi:flagellar assembly factor FliW|nr:Flagellar assembly factor FliW [Clostridia bacterium]
MDADTKKILFKEGIPGFEELKEFIILEDEGKEFYYLQAVNEPIISFVIIDPSLLKSDYAPVIPKSYFEKLGAKEGEAVTAFVIATIRENMEESTVNLQAPLLIHIENRIGVQAILEDKSYHSRHKIADLIKERGQ